jgi:hypothetical protein
MLATSNAQQPYVYGSLPNASIYFKPPELELVKAFDGFWDMKVVCDPVGKQSGWSSQILTTIKNGVLAGQAGILGKPGALTYEGTLDADGTIRIEIKGLTGDPRVTLGAPPRGSPTFWRAAGRLENSSGTALRTSGRRCVFAFTKQNFAKPGPKRTKA